MPSANRPQRTSTPTTDRGVSVTNSLRHVAWNILFFNPLRTCLVSTKNGPPSLEDAARAPPQAAPLRVMEEQPFGPKTHVALVLIQAHHEEVATRAHCKTPTNGGGTVS